MRCLLDTHLLLWAAADSPELPGSVRAVLLERDNDLFFSAASIWEVAIKASLNREDFAVDPPAFRRGLLNHDYEELPITGAHALGVDELPFHHKDPFDRMLIAQAQLEGLTLLTSDRQLTRYQGPISFHG